MNTPTPSRPDGPLPSPCIGVCRLDADSLCIGCHRSVHEIAEWPYATTARQREILGQVALRCAAPPTSG